MAFPVAQPPTGARQPGGAGLLDTWRGVAPTCEKGDQHPSALAPPRVFRGVDQVSIRASPWAERIFFCSDMGTGAKRAKDMLQVPSPLVVEFKSR